MLNNNWETSKCVKRVIDVDILKLVNISRTVEQCSNIYVKLLLKYMHYYYNTNFLATRDVKYIINNEPGVY